MKLLRVKQVSELTGFHSNMLRDMHKNGKIVPSNVSEAGTRYYSEDYKTDQGVDFK